MAYPNTSLNLNQEQLAAIGLLSVRWSFFETEMDFTIAALGEMVEQDSTLPRNINERLKRWRKLAVAFFTTPEVSAIAIRLIDQVFELHRARCTVLHGRCYADPVAPDQHIVVEVHRHLSDWGVQAITTNCAALIRTADDLESLAADLIRFNGSYLPIAPSSFPRIRS